MRETYFCIEENGYERNNNEGRNEENDELSNLVLLVDQFYCIYVFLEKDKELDIIYSSIQF